MSRFYVIRQGNVRGRGAYWTDGVDPAYWTDSQSGAFLFDDRTCPGDSAALFAEMTAGGIGGRVVRIVRKAVP